VPLHSIAFILATWAKAKSRKSRGQLASVATEFATERAGTSRTPATFAPPWRRSAADKRAGSLRPVRDLRSASLASNVRSSALHRLIALRVRGESSWYFMAEPSSPKPRCRFRREVRARERRTTAATVDSLKALDPDWPIREAAESGALLTNSCYARYDLDGFGNSRCTYWHSARSIQYRR
jgi:hypothetical protein